MVVRNVAIVCFDAVRRLAKQTVISEKLTGDIHVCHTATANLFIPFGQLLGYKSLYKRSQAAYINARVKGDNSHPKPLLSKQTWRKAVG